MTSQTSGGRDVAGVLLGAELSDAVVSFHEAVGALLGLSAADHKALGIVRRDGPMSAGLLAERTALTAGAVTGLVDRLEAAGLVRRSRDPQDRRRLVIEATAGPSEEVAAAFDALQRAMAGVTAEFSDAELAVVERWVRATTQVLRDQAAALAARP
ncbi:MarR family winged helix-turn-helix transcriptional regulator [Mumia quercus]|uniref:MarR family winged helix-turn-helix transcriptional regulator n=1 Tax=Mumia quercus TaxID=2976125 RepID=UPI0021D3C963|nr:MarR family transcriptional regulator [Mumia quercus]